MTDHYVLVIEEPLKAPSQKDPNASKDVSRDVSQTLSVNASHSSSTSASSTSCCHRVRKPFRFLKWWELILFFLMVAGAVAGNIYNLISSINRYYESLAHPTVSVTYETIDTFPAFKLVSCPFTRDMQPFDGYSNLTCYFDNSDQSLTGRQPCGETLTDVWGCSMFEMPSVLFFPNGTQSFQFANKDQRFDSLLLQQNSYDGANSILFMSIPWAVDVKVTTQDLLTSKYGLQRAVSAERTTMLNFQLREMDKTAIGGNVTSYIVQDTAAEIKDTTCGYSDIGTSCGSFRISTFSPMKEKWIYSFAFSKGDVVVATASILGLSISVIKFFFPKVWMAQHGLSFVGGSDPSRYL